MVDAIRIDVDVLREHARALNILADDVGEAVSATRTVMMGAEAFGLMCSFLVPPTLAVTGATMLVMTSEQGMLERTADELRAVASDTEEQEHQRVDSLKRLGEMLK